MASNLSSTKAEGGEVRAPFPSNIIDKVIELCDDCVNRTKNVCKDSRLTNEVKSVELTQVEKDNIQDEDVHRDALPQRFLVSDLMKGITRSLQTPGLLNHAVSNEFINSVLDEIAHSRSEDFVNMVVIDMVSRSPLVVEVLIHLLLSEASGSNGSSHSDIGLIIPKLALMLCILCRESAQDMGEGSSSNAVSSKQEAHSDDINVTEDGEYLVWGENVSTEDTHDAIIMMDTDGAKVIDPSSENIVELKCPFCPFEMTGQNEETLCGYFDKHLKLKHCDKDDKILREELKKFSDSSMWIDNPVCPYLGRVFVCPFCERTVTKSDSYYSHLLCHQGVKTPFICFKCHLEFSSYEALFKHYESKHGTAIVCPKIPVVKVQCPKTEEIIPKTINIDLTDSDEVAVSSTNLDSKSETEKIVFPKKRGRGRPRKYVYHTGQVSSGVGLVSSKSNPLISSIAHKCSRCGETFPTHLLKMRHINKIRKCHTETPTKAFETTAETDSKQVDPKRYSCNLCDFVCESPVTIRDHKSSNHRLPYQFVCERCGKSFPRPSRLAGHMCSVLGHTYAKQGKSRRERKLTSKGQAFFSSMSSGNKTVVDVEELDGEENPVDKIEKQKDEEKKVERGKVKKYSRKELANKKYHKELFSKEKKQQLLDMIKKQREQINEDSEQKSLKKKTSPLMKKDSMVVCKNKGLVVKEKKGNKKKLAPPVQQKTLAKCEIDEEGNIVFTKVCEPQSKLQKVQYRQNQHGESVKIPPNRLLSSGQNAQVVIPPSSAVQTIQTSEKQILRQSTNKPKVICTAVQSGSNSQVVVEMHSLPKVVIPPETHFEDNHVEQIVTLPEALSSSLFHDPSTFESSGGNIQNYQQTSHTSIQKQTSYPQGGFMSQNSLLSSPPGIPMSQLHQVDTFQTQAETQQAILHLDSSASIVPDTCNSYSTNYPMPEHSESLHNQSVQSVATFANNPNVQVIYHNEETDTYDVPAGFRLVKLQNGDLVLEADGNNA